MKKIFVLALLALGAIFVTGRVSLGESGAQRFIGQMETLMGEGKADEVCEMFHDDIEVVLNDESVAENSFTGGKDELCERTRKVAAAMQLLPHTMNVTFEDLVVEREWLHPWTSTVSYLEDRSLTIDAANVTLHTLSEDTITLVQTLSGVKLLKLHANVSLVE